MTAIPQKMVEIFDIEGDFNPDQYRKSLKERLGISNMPTAKLNKVDFVGDGSALVKSNEEHSDPIVPVTAVEDVKATGAVPGQPNVAEVGAEAEVPDENLAPAEAMLDALMAPIDKQAANTSRVEKAMWYALHNYLHTNRIKICKDVMKAAGK